MAEIRAMHDDGYKRRLPAEEGKEVRRENKSERARKKKREEGGEGRRRERYMYIYVEITRHG